MRRGDQRHTREAHLCSCGRIRWSGDNVPGRYALRLEELREYEGRQHSHLVGLYRSQACARAWGWGPVGVQTWCQLTSRLTDKST